MLLWRMANNGTTYVVRRNAVLWLRGKVGEIADKDAPNKGTTHLETSVICTSPECVAWNDWQCGKTDKDQAI
ncbi:uncharacterized protein SPSK_03818 [Sporothrix schenckii 1099-18]|uniref:Uncharacterized protein n=1 Tax=Sporothrix schenckii 1099-18 TaxID=1397361 RepID=A0A0F2LYK2_SPOSC|nr:uncharacterized protein SPSK_03818 [Sporothrix schenckii 1099-18]KJR82538.1 hypothetical protein SPSK_03818 [Sporothrix schenckii 1099-18]